MTLLWRYCVVRFNDAVAIALLRVFFCCAEVAAMMRYCVYFVFAVGCRTVLAMDGWVIALLALLYFSAER